MNLGILDLLIYIFTLALGVKLAFRIIKKKQKSLLHNLLNGKWTLQDISPLVLSKTVLSNLFFLPFVKTRILLTLTSKLLLNTFLSIRFV